MKKRSYKVTFALKEGYAPNGKVHNLSFAGNIIKSWMEARLEKHLPVVSGLLQEGQLFFPATSQVKEESVTVSPTGVFYGELSSDTDLKRKNKEVRETLESLAKKLKEKLNQESVFIVYREVNWCV